MESIGLDMDDLFDQDAPTLEEELEAELDTPIPMLPDLDTGELPMAEEADAENADDGEGAQLNRLIDLSKGAAKRKVQRPQPKLDATRLKGERGLPMLPNMFKDEKFKGRGHEARDLKVMMGMMEHWAHRLFPKIPFDEFIERLERLGAKKEVQNCVKRMRLDMPVTDEDYVTQFDDEEKKDEDGVDEDAGAAAATAVDDEEELDAEAAFEQMIQRENEAIRREKEELEGVTRTASPGRGGDMEEPDEDSPSGKTPPKTPPPTASIKPAATPGSMSAEQKARIEKNKLLALKKRAARLGVPVEQLMSPKPSSSPKAAEDLQNTVSDDAVMESDAGEFTQPLNPKSPAANHGSPSSGRVRADSQASSQENDQHTEEELMLALELDTDESFSKTDSDAKKSPQTDCGLNGHENSMSEEFSVGEKFSVPPDHDSEAMSEEISVIANGKAGQGGGVVENGDEMSEEFSVLQTRKGVRGKAAQNSVDMETEELSEVLVVNNNVAKRKEVVKEQNKLSQSEMEQIDFEEMDSESVPLI